MIATDDDAALLISFARHGDEAAFRALAARHLGLVFHTALRRTGNRPMAEEVTQNVLCAVAGKAASLARHPERFQPWLHRAALYESTKAMRKEAAHQRRKQLLHPDEMPGTSHAEQEAAWQAALPHLDVALDQLPEGDRRVVLLHFFERQTFPRIAALLGKSPDAVQKQSVRALEKLSRVLRSKGMAVPVGMLATGIATESAKAAPMGLLPGLTGKALAAAAAGGTAGHGVSLTLATHSKLWVAAAVVVVALPLGFQQMAIAQAEAELASLKSRPSAVGAVLRPTAARNREIWDVSDRLDLAKLAEEAARGTKVQSVKLALDRKLAALEAPVLDGMLAGTKRLETAGDDNRYQLAQFLIRALAKKDLPRVVERVSRDWMGMTYDATMTPWVVSLFKDWMKADLPAARVWLEGLQQRPESLAAREDEEARKPLLELQGPLMERLLAVDGEAARRYLATSPPEAWQMSILEKVVRPDSGQMSVSQADHWVTAIRDLSDADRDKMLGKLTAKRGLEMSEPLLKAPGATPAEQRRIEIMAVKTFLSDLDTPFNPGQRETARGWLKRMLPGEEAGAVAIAAEQELDEGWAEAAKGALVWIRGFAQVKDIDPDFLAMALTKNVFKGDQIQAALDLAEELPKPSQREQTREIILNNSKR